jgi:Cu/Ag efflux protein CusF
MKDYTMQTIKTVFIAATSAALVASGAPAFAQATMDHSKMIEIKMAENGAGDMSDAEVRKVDKEQGKITLKHGEIKNLDMPSMTMVFAVKDKAMLDTVKPGDKVRFRAVDDNGKLTVVEMAAAQ